MDLSSAYAAPDAAAVDAMGTDARNAWLGNALYPQISAITGTALAAKVTGMLLEMPTATLLGFLGNTEALATIVDEAVAVLPPEVCQSLQATAAAEPATSPSAISPVSVLAGSSGELWADEDEDDEPLPPVGAMLEAEQRKSEARKRLTQAGGPGTDAMETEDSWTCEWDAAALAAQPVDKLSEWIAARLDEPQVRIVRAVVDILGAHVALELLAATERVQANGGWMVEETGKPRTSGGIYVCRCARLRPCRCARLRPRPRPHLHLHTCTRPPAPSATAFPCPRLIPPAHAHTRPAHHTHTLAEVWQVKLLRDATHLDAAQAAATLQRIKVEGAYPQPAPSSPRSVWTWSSLTCSLPRRSVPRTVRSLAPRRLMRGGVATAVLDQVRRRRRPHRRPRMPNDVSSRLRPGCP